MITSPQASASSSAVRLASSGRNSTSPRPLSTMNLTWAWVASVSASGPEAPTTKALT